MYHIGNVGIGGAPVAGYSLTSRGTTNVPLYLYHTPTDPSATTYCGYFEQFSTFTVDQNKTVYGASYQV
jgi:hypothetical protein